ncbi:MAG: PAS domain S-box protein [Acidobacteria bacterium]|nr:PAS domain S-box protein [Acidobacteriota bacterium]
MPDRAKSRKSSNELTPSIFGSPELLARILDIADDAVISIDDRQRICVFNQGAERVFGYSCAEVMGQPLEKLIPGRFRRAHQHHMGDFTQSSVAARAMAHRGEVFGLRKGGEEFPAEASISKVQIDGSMIFTVILRDISERKQTEQRLLEALAEKEILLREVHHRVKNNLQVISSLLNLQARATSDEELARAFEESQNRVQSMALIHEQLYEAHDLTDVDFPEYIRQLTSRLFRTYQVRGDRIQLKTTISDVRIGVDLAVPCGLILNELISNSLKHAFPDAREGSIEIRLERMHDASVVLTVADDGVGLPPDVGFWSTKTLGLRLVRSLVRQIDGEIDLAGPPGSEFRIRFSVESEQKDPL